MNDIFKLRNEIINKVQTIHNVKVLKCIKNMCEALTRIDE